MCPTLDISERDFNISSELPMRYVMGRLHEKMDSNKRVQKSERCGKIGYPLATFNMKKLKEDEQEGACLVSSKSPSWVAQSSYKHCVNN